MATEPPKSGRAGKQALKPLLPVFVGVADLLPEVSPGELAAIAACLRLIKRKGKPSNCFGEAMQLVTEAAQFLRDSKPRPEEMEVKRGSRGQVETTTIDTPGVILRQVPPGGLSFATALSRTGEFDKRGKPTTWFGSVTTEKHLRELVRKSVQKEILGQSEAEAILKKREFDPYQ